MEDKDRKSLINYRIQQAKETIELAEFLKNSGNYHGDFISCNCPYNILTQREFSDYIFFVPLNSLAV